MKIAYYPGCSLERNASAYHDSAMAVAEPLGIEFQEIDDWNCCGASEYIALEALPAYSAIARNLAIAERETGAGGTLVAPCSMCFLNLSKVDHHMSETAAVEGDVNRALAAGGLHYDAGSVNVRHLLHVVVEDVGLEAVKAQVKKPLYGLRVAAYYGCLIVRPAYGHAFDDTEQPMSMDRLVAALGATVVDYPMKAQCCGGHMTQISEPVALEMIRRLLHNAAEYSADMIVTLCPMCQLNLDAYQDAVNKHFGTDYHIPILYFTQLMGLAFGYDAKRLGIGKEFVSANPALARIGVEPPEPSPAARPPKEALPMPGSAQED